MPRLQGRIFCHRFPASARTVERFTGPFNHKLAHPILVIGNEVKVISCVYTSHVDKIYQADPTTPLANAQTVAATLGDSARLLVQNGLGVSLYLGLSIHHYNEK